MRRISIVDSFIIYTILFGCIGALDREVYVVECVLFFEPIGQWPLEAFNRTSYIVFAGNVDIL